MEEQEVAVEWWTRRPVLWRLNAIAIMLLAWTGVNSVTLFMVWNGSAANHQWLTKHEAQIRTIDQIEKFDHDLEDIKTYLEKLLPEEKEDGTSSLQSTD